MPRVPYQYPEPGTSSVADAIRSRRADGQLIQLDGVLLNAPSLAAGYSSLLRSVRLENSLPADLRELLILRVAVLNNAAYEWIAHEKVGRDAGLTGAQLAVIRDGTTALRDNVDPTGALSELQVAGLIYADWMTKNVHVPQRIFDGLKKHLNDEQVVEVTLTVGTYNMVSRFLVALDVADMAEARVPEV